jgi:hypothetical protein
VSEQSQPSENADKVRAALRGYGIGRGEYCAALSDLAVASALSEGQVRRALAELTAAGEIEWTGRRREKSAVFRFLSNSLGHAASGSQHPHPHTSCGVGGVELSGDATDDAPSRASSVVEEVNEVEAAALRRIGLERLYGILDQLHEEELGPPDLPAGTCGECGEEEARSRYRLGSFELCRVCRRRRARAATMVGEPATPESQPLWPRPPLETVLVAEAMTRRNGHRREYEVEDLLQEVDW